VLPGVTISARRSARSSPRPPLSWRAPCRRRSWMALAGSGAKPSPRAPIRAAYGRSLREFGAGCTWPSRWVCSRGISSSIAR
jgi:hypothetical protein